MRTRLYVVLPVLITLASAARWPAVWYSYPFEGFVDEPYLVEIAYKMAREADPDQPEVLGLLGYLRLAAGDTEAALVFFRDFVGRVPPEESATATLKAETLSICKTIIPPTAQTYAAVSESALKGLRKSPEEWLPRYRSLEASAESLQKTA